MDSSPIVKCWLCGKQEKASYSEPAKTEMCVERLCFSCLFWMEKVRWREANDKNAVVVDGKHYYITPDVVGEHAFRGFGGEEFIVEFFDGRKVITHNLWMQGTIPKHFLRHLPDNARFGVRDNIVPFGGDLIAGSSAGGKEESKIEEALPRGDEPNAYVDGRSNDNV